MNRKNLKTIQSLSLEELSSKLRSTEADWFKAKMQNKLGQLEDTASLGRFRKQIAQIKTVMSQKQQPSAAKGTAR